MPLLFRPKNLVNGRIVRQSHESPAMAARERHNFGEASDKVFFSAMRTRRVAHVQRELHFTNRPLNIANRNGLDHGIALVTDDVRYAGIALTGERP